jgi:hypothetical protein
MKTLLTFILVLFLTASCNSVSTETITSNITYTSIPSETPNPTNTVSPTPSLTNRCLKVELSLPSNAQPSGKLVVAAQHPFLLDLKTGIKKDLDDNQGQFTVSPDGKWLASQYMDQSGKFWLMLESTDGTQQTPMDWKEDWFSLAGWLDNRHVWISHYIEPLVTVVDPFSDMQQELVPDFPGLETMAQAGEHYALGANTVLYDSSLNYAIYPRLENDGYVYLILWDRQANRVLAKIKHSVKSFNYYPLWSLDQTEFYVPLIDKWDKSKPDDFVYDFFSLNKNGRAKQLTEFRTISDNVNIGYASLSPDGKKIAFGLQMNSSKEQLAVLDLDTKQVINYCIPGSYHIWSLDSRYLAVQDQYEPNAGRVILIDMKEGWAAQIAEIKPIGWPAGWLSE